jgi:hypothetical protein
MLDMHLALAWLYAYKAGKYHEIHYDIYSWITEYY